MTRRETFLAKSTRKSRARNVAKHEACISKGLGDDWPRAAARNPRFFVHDVLGEPARSILRVVSRGRPRPRIPSATPKDALLKDPGGGGRDGEAEEERAARAVRRLEEESRLASANGDRAKGAEVKSDEKQGDGE
ncbi:hypothetical protein KM043_007303 [Ampulex compressa]|nr:hypothetical protein KM043_007303 [Ampulex compressa]